MYRSPCVVVAVAIIATVATMAVSGCKREFKAPEPKTGATADATLIAVTSRLDPPLALPVPHPAVGNR